MAQYRGILITGAQVVETVRTPTIRFNPDDNKLVMSCATSGATIRYTFYTGDALELLQKPLDPTQSSTIYTVPIILKSGQYYWYKAKAWKQGYEPSLIGEWQGIAT